MKVITRYIGTALAVAMALALLAACGGQSAQSEDTEEYLTDTNSIDGFDSLESDSDADDSESTDSESTDSESNNDNNNNSNNNEENTTTGGGSSGTVDLPILPV
jgi:hypothetical protein